MKEIEPLVVQPRAVLEYHGLPESISSNWVVQRVKNFCKVVGLSCEGFEDKLMALFSAIEASRNHNGSTSSSKFCSKLANKGNRELKRLAVPLIMI